MSSSITGLEDLQGALALAVDICNDERYGYLFGGSLDPQQGDYDTDCSGLIWYCLHQNGFEVGSSRFDTSTMMQVLRDYGGFTEYIYNPGQYSRYVPIEGDIVVHRETRQGHAFFYAENRLGFTDKYTSTRSIISRCKVEAVHDYNGLSGDSQEIAGGAFNEVWVNTFTGLYSNYTWHVFRWNGGQPSGGPLPIWMILDFKSKLERGWKDGKSYDGKSYIE